MTEEDDEGIEPIPTQDLLGGLPSDDEGIQIIGTEWEQRGGDGGDEDKRG